jgi:hypothetical protein
VDFDAWGADDVRGRRWHSSKGLTELGQGRLRVKLRLNSLEQVERWVLGFGNHATVVGLEELRQRLSSCPHQFCPCGVVQSTCLHLMQEITGAKPVRDAIFIGAWFTGNSGPT